MVRFFSKVKCIVYILLLGIILSVNYVVADTEVGGQILEDTTWTLEGSPYIITSTIQIDYGAILTIEPGVEVNGSIEVFGELHAIGTKDFPIFFNNAFITPQAALDSLSPNGLIKIEFSNLYDSFLFNPGNSRNGSIILKDSKVYYSGNMSIPDYLLYLTNINQDCYIERNIFIETKFLYISSINRDITINVKNNVFYNSKGYIDIANYFESSQVIFEFNSFLNINGLAISLSNNFGTENLKAINNYWGTTDTSVIDSMIYDKNDDLGIENYVEYQPFLTEPHPDTPIFNYNQLPTAYSGIEQVVFDEVILDGSGSNDPDGTIISYEWNLQNRSTYENFTATGVNPVISGLTNGFYDVCLTVTDDQNESHTDCSTIAAAGPCPNCPEPGECEICETCEVCPDPIVCEECEVCPEPDPEPKPTPIRDWFSKWFR